MSFSGHPRFDRLQGPISPRRMLELRDFVSRSSSTELREIRDSSPARARSPSPRAHRRRSAVTASSGRESASLALVRSSFKLAPARRISRTIRRSSCAMVATTVRIVERKATKMPLPCSLSFRRTAVRQISVLKCLIQSSALATRRSLIAMFTSSAILSASTTTVTL